MKLVFIKLGTDFLQMQPNYYGRQEVALNGVLQDNTTPTRQWVDATSRLRHQFRLAG